MISLATLLLGIIILFCLVPADPEISLHLTDGANFTITQVDSGPVLAFDGWPWRRFLAKHFGFTLQRFTRGASAVFPSHFTNGIGFVFSRRQEGHRLQDSNRILNGSGQLFLVDGSGHEQAAVLHWVNYTTEKINGKEETAAENLMWEIPNSKQDALHLRLYDTNTAIQKVSVYNLWVRNPAR